MLILAGGADATLTAPEGASSSAPQHTSLGAPGFGKPASARAAAELSQHCLRWVLSFAKDNNTASRKPTWRQINAASEELGLCLHVEADLLQRDDEMRSRKVGLYAKSTTEGEGSAGEGGGTSAAPPPPSAEKSKLTLRSVIRTGCHESCKAAYDEIHQLLAFRSPQALVGESILVLWPLDGEWYYCKVEKYDTTSGMHKVHYYFDGVIEWIDLNAEEWAQHDPSPLKDEACLRTSERSSLTRQLRGEALLATGAPPSQVLQELSLAVRLGSREGLSSRRYIQALLPSRPHKHVYSIALRRRRKTTRSVIIIVACLGCSASLASRRR